MKGCYISVGAGLDVSVLMDAVKDAENDGYKLTGDYEITPHDIRFQIKEVETKKRKGARRTRRTTGRFGTRKELVERILFLYQDPTCSNARIARNCNVSEASEATVGKIIRTKK